MNIKDLHGVAGIGGELLDGLDTPIDNNEL